MHADKTTDVWLMILGLGNPSVVHQDFMLYSPNCSRAPSKDTIASIALHNVDLSPRDYQYLPVSLESLRDPCVLI